jgi:hypothetical protein
MTAQEKECEPRRKNNDPQGLRGMGGRFKSFVKSYSSLSFPLVKMYPIRPGII